VLIIFGDENVFLLSAES